MMIKSEKLMKQIGRIFKNIQLKKILTVLLASSLMLISTACGSTDVAATGKKAIADTVQKVSTDSYDDYDANQPYKGGMNGYNDDRRYDAQTAAKAKGLVDTAQSRQKDNLGDYADSITDRAGNKLDEARRNIPRTIKENKDEAIDYIDNKSERLKRNLGKVPGEAKEAFDGAVDTAQEAIKDANQATKSTTKEIKGNFKDLT